MAGHEEKVDLPDFGESAYWEEHYVKAAADGEEVYDWLVGSNKPDFLFTDKALESAIAPWQAVMAWRCRRGRSWRNVMTDLFSTCTASSTMASMRYLARQN
ncbi:unnamed protein product [Durusdinium trenchii]|uniref:Uncharacterized protein n=1 Tax=Durusdinium trenchii TaxID=1381693 RepID=A0ABP0SFH0_9DINO